MLLRDGTRSTVESEGGTAGTARETQRRGLVAGGRLFRVSNSAHHSLSITAHATHTTRFARMFARAPVARAPATLSQRKVAPATIAAFALLRIQVSFFGFDAVTRGLTRLRRRRDRCKAHAIGCWYGAAYLQRVMRCPQLLSLATGGAARCSAAGERLIAGHRPTVFGRVASAGAESDCVLEVLECSLTPWAPRSDLYHRSGRGAF